jgi:hypothetical protein
MTRFLTIAALFLALSAPVMARTFPVPPAGPAWTVTTPKDWKVEEIEHGYSAVSPGDDVFFSVEYAASEKGFDAMMKTNEDWMKENKIKLVKPTREEGKVNGIDMLHYEFDTTDENGKTLVDLMFLPAGNSMAMLTVWGSVKERNRHQAEILSILNSVKPTP